MNTVRYVLGCCLLVQQTLSAHADACSDLQAAIAKGTALRQEMQREAAPFVSSGQIPARQEGVCAAAQKLRDHIVDLAKKIDSKCLNDDQYRSTAAILGETMREANDNIGLFCN